MTKFIRLKTHNHGHYDDQTLKARVNHMIKFLRLKIEEYKYYDNQILRTRISHMTKFTRLMSKIVIKRE